MVRTRRWPWILSGLFVCGLGISLYCLGVPAFKAWQVRHSYRLRMTLARPYATTDPLYSLDALRRNRQVVRQWIEDDLLVRRCVGDLSSHKTRKQISLLTHFGEPPDLEILWRKAEQGFPLPPPPPQGTRVEPDPRIEQRELCFYLIINGILWTCIDVAGGEVEGLRMYHKGFRERKIAPEVREAYEEGLAMSAGQPKE